MAGPLGAAVRVARPRRRPGLVVGCMHPILKPPSDQRGQLPRDVRRHRGAQHTRDGVRLLGVVLRKHACVAEDPRQAPQVPSRQHIPVRGVCVFAARNGASAYFVRWLDITPTSRVITRCTQDIQAGKDTIRVCFTETDDFLKWTVLYRTSCMVSVRPFLTRPTSISLIPHSQHHHQPHGVLDRGRAVHTRVPSTGSRHRRGWRSAGPPLHQGAAIHQA